MITISNLKKAFGQTIASDIPSFQVNDGDILGLYVGIPLSERGDSYGFGEQPDVIYLFKGPHERLEGTREEIIEQVRRTVVHEIGHYFGMDEEQLDAMGYGDPTW